MAQVSLEPTWKQRLETEFSKPYMLDLKTFLQKEKAGRKIIYPKGNEFFAALNETPFDRVKVVILGQDPYHGPHQAHGLCFSVQNGVPPPPSLINIFKELHDDVGVKMPTSGNLTKWAQQGVFLLNASLTVRAGDPMSHSKIGWAEFTNMVIKKISDLKEHVVFLLWGKFAQEKKVLIDESKHLILKASHPSPLSITGFMGCRHFSKTNEYLVKNGIDPIDWSL